jgi:hypothetical protein
MFLPKIMYASTLPPPHICIVHSLITSSYLIHESCLVKNANYPILEFLCLPVTACPLSHVLAFDGINNFSPALFRQDARN